MKLSEMTTDQSIDALVSIATPVSNIVEDDALVQQFKEYQDSGDKPMMELLPQMLKKLVPALFQKHRADMYKIVSVLSGKSVQDIKAQPMSATIADVREIFDTDLMDFFTSSVNSETKP